MIFHLCHYRNKYLPMDLLFENAQFFVSMNSAIKNAAAAKIDVKVKLGKELVTTLDQLQRDFYVEYNEMLAEEVKESFMELRAV